MLEQVHGEQSTNFDQQNKSKQGIMSLSVFSQTKVFQEPKSKRDGAMLENTIEKNTEISINLSSNTAPCQALTE